MLVREADGDYVDKHSDRLIMFADVPSTHWAYLDIIEATNEHDYQIKNDKETWK